MAGDKLLLYGSYGYSGQLIAKRAVQEGLRPVLAGRDAGALAKQGGELGLEHRVAPLDDARALDNTLRDARAVLHCAGPFINTWRPISDACIRGGVHYLDITGEIAVFEALAARDAEARAAGVMLLPGVGFDVVTTDCLAAHLARRLPGSTRLLLAFQTVGGVSRGTALTMVENMPRGSAIRRDGELVPVPFAHATRTVDFGRGDRLTVAHPWGDLSTAYRSTGIANIEVYRATSPAELRLLRGVRLLHPVVRSAPARALLRWAVRRGRSGPDSEARRTGYSRLWGEVRHPNGIRASALLLAPEAYTLTAATAVACAQRVLRGEVLPGFATPAMAYGADLVLGIDGVTRQDVV